ncbi:MAG: trypsin-like peptidase domain-containing protein [Flavobacteriaceae bacterium]|nr:trypsin-like peptidase domain-containing protein [Flavobacteriaceae bacterium]
MKKTFELIIVSVLGGCITLGSYLFVTKNTSEIQFNSTEVNGKMIPTNLNYKTLYAAENTDFIKVAEESLNAVVHVKNISIQTVRDPFAEYFYGRSSERKFEQIGIGSGVIISSDGYIVTNNHVVQNATDIEITLNNKKKYKAKLIGTDANNDIALIKIDVKDLSYIPFGNSDNVRVGEWVLAVGNPYNLTSTVTAGIVSAKGRDLDGNNNIDSFIQTDAAVNQGNSGGALVNTRGELVGINTAITSLNGAFIGYSFAIPSNIVKKTIEDLIEFGTVQKAYLGIYYEELNNEKAKALKVDSVEGIIITNVLDKGAAKDAGLLENDIIVKINEVKITKFGDLNGQLKSKRPGEIVKITVNRKGNLKEFNVKLKNQFGKVDLGKFDFTKFYIGDVKPIGNEDILKFKIKNGLKISKISNSILKERFGINNGDIILGIDDHIIKTEKELEYQLEKGQDKQYVILKILLVNGQLEYVPIKIN